MIYWPHTKSYSATPKGVQVHVGEQPCAITQEGWRIEIVNGRLLIANAPTNDCVGRQFPLSSPFALRIQRPNGAPYSLTSHPSGALEIDGEHYYVQNIACKSVGTPHAFLSFGGRKTTPNEIKPQPTSPDLSPPLQSLPLTRQMGDNRPSSSPNSMPPTHRRSSMPRNWAPVPTPDLSTINQYAQFLYQSRSVEQRGLQRPVTFTSNATVSSLARQLHLMASSQDNAQNTSATDTDVPSESR